MQTFLCDVATLILLRWRLCGTEAKKTLENEQHQFVRDDNHELWTKQVDFRNSPCKQQKHSISCPRNYPT